MDRQESTSLVSLDLSAAFGTTDRHVLISRLHILVVVSLVRWITSYLLDISQMVSSAFPHVLPHLRVFLRVVCALYSANCSPRLL